MEVKEMKLLFDIIVSGPGMDEQVKLNFTASRKTILLLADILANGLQSEGGPLKESIGQAGISELQNLKELLLERSNLTALSNQLVKIK
ncbi:hypothetical protein D3C71_26640 [compost metagenome]|jgi:hypothetical protein